MQRLRRLEKARAERKGNPLALFAAAVGVIFGGSRAQADDAVDAIPRKRLRRFARGMLDRIAAARELAALDEAEDDGG